MPSLIGILWQKNKKDRLTWNEMLWNQTYKIWHLIKWGTISYLFFKRVHINEHILVFGTLIVLYFLNSVFQVQGVIWIHLLIDFAHSFVWGDGRVRFPVSLYIHFHLWQPYIVDWLYCPPPAITIVRIRLKLPCTIQKEVRVSKSW